MRLRRQQEKDAPKNQEFSHFSGVSRPGRMTGRGQAKRDTAFQQGDKRSAAPPDPPYRVRRLAALVVVRKQSGVALRLPPHSISAHPRAKAHRTEGLKGRGIIAQGK